MTMDYDDVIPHIGGFGRYQRKVYFCLCLAMVTCAFNEMGGVFLSAKTDFRCLLPQENLKNASFLLPLDVANKSYPWHHKTKTSSRCEKYHLDLIDQFNTSNGNPLISYSTEKCDSFVYDKSQFTLTTTTEFNLVCDSAWLRAVGDSALMFGMMLGSMIFGVLSDRYGRKVTLCLALTIQTFGGILVVVSPGFSVFLISRVIVGFTTSGVVLVDCVIAIEMVSLKQRSRAEMGVQAFFVLGYILIAGLAYTIRNWRILQIAFIIPSAAYLLYWWLIPESVRWLLTKGRLEEAKNLIQKASSENGVELSPDILDSLLNKDIESATNFEQPSVFDLLRFPNLRKKSLVIFFIWFVISATYYGIAWNTSNLAGNEFVNFGISAGIEIPALLFLIFTLDRWGRKIILCGCMLLVGTSLLCTLLVADDMPWLVVVFAMIGKFGATSSIVAILVFAAEQFPTVIRNIGLGVGSAIAKIGAMTVPYINLLADVWTPLPFAVFGTCSLIAGLLTLLLPETLNKKLPESIHDCEMFGRKTKRDIEGSYDLNTIKP